MPGIDTNFFLHLDAESSADMDEGAIQVVFQNETNVLSKDNSQYVKELRRQMEALERLRKYKKQ